MLIEATPSVSWLYTRLAVIRESHQSSFMRLQQRTGVAPPLPRPPSPPTLVSLGESVTSVALASLLNFFFLSSLTPIAWVFMKLLPFIWIMRVLMRDYNMSDKGWIADPVISYLFHTFVWNSKFNFSNWNSYLRSVSTLWEKKIVCSYIEPNKFYCRRWRIASGCP